MAGVLGQFLLARVSCWGGENLNCMIFSLTAANYEAAIDILKRRFGRKIAIERAHVNDLLKVLSVHHDKNTVGLRRLYVTFEVYHRGHRALGVNATHVTEPRE